MKTLSLEKRSPQSTVVPERRLEAEELESRVLYSAAPVAVIVDELQEAAPVVETFGTGDFDSLDAFLESRPNIDEAESADLGFVTLTSFANLTAEEIAGLLDGQTDPGCEAPSIPPARQFTTEEVGADTPHILMNFDGTNRDGLRISYTVSGESSAREIGAQFRFANSGAFTNIPPDRIELSEQCESTVVTASLPGAASGQPHIEVRLLPGEGLEFGFSHIKMISE